MNMFKSKGSFQKSKFIYDVLYNDCVVCDLFSDDQAPHLQHQSCIAYSGIEHLTSNVPYLSYHHSSKPNT